MSLPRLFNRSSEPPQAARGSTIRSKQVKQVNEAVEAGLYPVRVASRARIRLFRFMSGIALITLVLVIVVSAFGGIDPIRQFFQPLQGKAGGLVVSSEYSKVSIKLDGKVIGQSPYTGQDIPVGNHTITCEVIANTNNFFIPAVIPVQIFSGNTTVVRVNPAPTSDLLSYTIISSQDRSRQNDPKLIVKAVPSDVTVKLDGSLMGAAPQSFTNIASGAHQLLLEKQGYRPVTIDVTVAEEKSVTVEVRMYQYQVTVKE